MRWRRGSGEKAIQVSPALERHGLRNVTWYNITTQVGSAADELAHKGLERPILSLGHRQDHSLIPGTLVIVASNALAANPTISRGVGPLLPSLAQQSRDFIGEQVGHVLTMINAEPVGAQISPGHRRDVRHYIAPTTQDISAASDVVEDLIDMRMAGQDGKRAGMTAEQKRRDAMLIYAKYVANTPRLLKIYGTNQIRDILAICQANGFLIDVWGPPNVGDAPFYVKLAEAATDAITVGNPPPYNYNELHDPLRMGIGTALLDDQLGRTSLWGPKWYWQRNNAAPELQFAEMWRSITRAAFNHLLTQRLFNTTGAGSEAYAILEAYQVYLQQGGVGDATVQSAIVQTRAHLADVATRTARDVVDYAFNAPPVHLSQLITANVANNVGIPRSNKDFNSTRATELVVRLATEIDEHSITGTQNVAGLIGVASKDPSARQSQA